MIVIRCTTRGLQQTFRAIAPALQASTYSSSSTWVAAGEGGKGGGWGGGAWGKWGIRWRPRRCCDSRKVKSWLGWICSAHCIPGWSKDWRRGHICRRLWGEERDPFNRGHINYTEYSVLLLFFCWLPLRELLVKSFFTEQCVNTGGANLLYYPFSQRAITPTTLLPKTRLTSVSIKSFTPWIKPSLCVCACVCQWVCECVQHLRKQRTSLWPPEWLGAGVSACMQNSCGIIAPSLSCTGGHLSHARRVESRRWGWVF